MLLLEHLGEVPPHLNAHGVPPPAGIIRRFVGKPNGSQRLPQTLTPNPAPLPFRKVLGPGKVLEKRERLVPMGSLFPKIVGLMSAARNLLKMHFNPSKSQALIHDLAWLSSPGPRLPPWPRYREHQAGLCIASHFTPRSQERGVRNPFPLKAVPPRSRPVGIIL